MRQIIRRRRPQAVALRVVTRRTAALVVVPLALAACGSTSESNSGSSSQGEQASSTVHRYYDAFLRDNGHEACSFFTGELRREQAEEYERNTGQTARTGGKIACPEALERGREHLTSDEVGEVEHDKISVASLSGTSATVIVTQNSHTKLQIGLSKTPAGWLISTHAISAG